MPGLDRRWTAAIVRCLARQPEKRFKSVRDVIPALDRPSRRPRFALPLAVSAVVLLLVGAYAFVRYRPSLRLREPQKTALVAAPRPAVAILGFRNELASPKLDWLPTAVTELLAHELAAAESSLRVIDTVIDSYDVQAERRSLGVSEDDIGDAKSLERMQAVLGANVLVHGSLSPNEPGSVDVRLRVQALDAQSRKDRGVFEENLGPDAARLTEAIPQLAGRLRAALGASLTDEQDAALSASRAHNLDAARAYAEGMMRKQRWELEDARSLFEAALTADPGFLDAQRRIWETWRTQENDKKARETYERLRARTSGLTARQAAVLDARISDSVEAWAALFEATPDEYEFGLELFERTPLKGKLALLRRLRQLPAYPPVELDIREAKIAWQNGDPQYAEELFSRVAGRAVELGARTELADVRRLQANMLYLTNPLRLNEALARIREAEQLYAQVGELNELAGAKWLKQSLVGDMGLLRDSLAAQDEAAGAFRRLGNRKRLTMVLQDTAEGLQRLGELDAASKKLDEARAEQDSLGEPPGTGYFQVRAFLALDAGDIHAARDALRQVRGDKDDAFGLTHEADVLYEQDRLEEARSAGLKAATLAAQWGNQIWVTGIVSCRVDCDGDNPDAGLSCLAQHCQAEQAGIRWGYCRFVEARCRFRASDFAGAEEAARDALSVFERSDEYERGLLTRTLVARIAAARGESASSIRTLRSELAKVESKHNKKLAFEVRLALGDVELKAGRPEGRARLLKLEQEAKSREFFRIARLAREALEQNGGHTH